MRAGSDDGSTVSGYLAGRKSAKPLLVPNHPERPKIVSDRPPPVEARGGLRKFDHFYPFEEMKVGDSFWVPAQSSCTAGAVTKFSKRTGWKFTSRGEAEDGRTNGKVGPGWRGTRVWRIG